MSIRSFKRAHVRREARERRRATVLRRRAGSVAGVAVSAAMFVSSAQAATYTVQTANDDAPGTGCDTANDTCQTLRDAITQANTDGTADTIEFDSSLSGDTITLKAPSGEDEYQYNPLDLYDTGGATIQGPAGGITVSGDGQTQILDVGNGADSISGLTFTDGNSHGTNGGAIEVTGGSGLTLINDTISGSTTSDDGGGGIYSEEPLTLTGSTVMGNTSAYGDGGGIQMNDRADLTVTDSTISGNNSDEDGGAIEGGHHVSIAGTKILNNTATDSGGGLFLNPKYGATVTGSTISGNTAGTNAGGVGISAYVEEDEGYGPKYDPIQIASSTISGNQAPEGAGINVESADSPITISSSTLSGNGTAATTFGGGLAIDGYVYSKFKVIDSTISGNTAMTGGGVSLGDASHDRLTGGAEGTTGSIAFDNSTIDANSATQHGGGIYLGEYSSGSPAAENSAAASITSTIVANDTPNDLERASGSTSGGFDAAFSLIQNPGSAPLTENEVIVGKDPLLNPLANNGGATETMEPKSTSPAIDQGHASPNLATDQNGNKRTVVNQGITHPPGGDGTDIGSVELQAGQAFIPPTPTPPPAQSPGFGVSVQGKSLGPSPLLVFRYKTPVTCSVKHGSLASCVIEVHARNGMLIADGEIIGNNSSLTALVIRTPAGFTLLQKNPLAGVGATMSAVGSPTGLPTVSGTVNFLAGQSLRFHITSNDLTGTLKAQLSELAKVIAGAKTVTCTAYTDRPKGDTTTADAMADKIKTAGEAQAVCGYLGRHGLSGATFTSHGKGHKNPIGSNKTVAGRSENQRVRISFTF